MKIKSVGFKISDDGLTAIIKREYQAIKLNDRTHELLTIKGWKPPMSLATESPSDQG
jgi:hypothetical protein